MTEINNTCDYFLDPDTPDTWNGQSDEDCQIHGKIINEEGYWNCPHQSVDGEQYCIAHLDIEKKNDEEVVDEIVDIITGSKKGYDNPQKKKQFLGAQFGCFDLSDYDLLGTEDRDEKIDLSHSTFKNSVDWSSVQMLSDIKLSGATFKQPASFIDTHFKSIEADRVSFERLANFSNVNFNKRATFQEAEFSGRVNFELSRFHESAYFANTQFNDDAIFQNVRFESNAFFWDTTFEAIANFDVQEFNCDVEFLNAVFNDSALFHSFETPGCLSFQGSIFAGPVHFTNLTIREDTDFEETIFKKEAKFVGTVFNGHITFEDAKFNGIANFHRVDLTDAYFTNADLRSANFESTLLSRATLFKVDLRGAKLAGAVLGDVRIDEDTQFLGHPDDDSDTSPHTFSAMFSTPRCVYDPMYEEDNDEADDGKAKSVYRALEELSGKAARTRLQSQCFVRRQDLQKREYKRVMFGKDNGKKSEKEDTGNEEETTYGEQEDAEKKSTESEEESPSLEERLIAGGRYCRTKVARMTLLYGESPWRIIGGSLGFIIFAALLYPLNDWLRPTGGESITYSRILSGEPDLFLESLYFSTLTFTTLGMGDYEPMGFGQVIATLNTTLGAVLIALLVFVLGRRAAR